MNRRPILLDVNVLFALLWPRSEFHVAVRAWFRGQASSNWSTCPVTQSGFVRLLSNPALSVDAPSVEDAMSLLRSNLTHPGHVFWPDDLDLLRSIELSGAKLQGHRQITDAYLLGLAIHRKGHFATLDKSVASLLPGNRDAAGWIIDLSKTLRQH